MIHLINKNKETFETYQTFEDIKLEDLVSIFRNVRTRKNSFWFVVATTKTETNLVREFFQKNVNFWEEDFALKPKFIFLPVPKSHRRFKVSNKSTLFSTLKKFFTTEKRFIKRLQNKYIVDKHYMTHKDGVIDFFVKFHDDNDAFLLHKKIDANTYSIIANGDKERATNYLAMNKISRMLATELRVTKAYVKRYQEEKLNEKTNKVHS